MKMKLMKNTYVIGLLALVLSCSGPAEKAPIENEPVQKEENSGINVAGDNFIASNVGFNTSDGMTTLDEPGWLAFEIDVAEAGRYRVSLTAQGNGLLWIEDYVGNKDDRTYDITGKFESAEGLTTMVKEGSPLNKGVHQMRIHSDQPVSIRDINFELMIKHQETPQTLTQNMEGEEWKLVWSDEFDGTAVDESKWINDIGDWGWGNNELQYYKGDNASVADGKLTIEATKNADGKTWSSARLTTRGKTSFLYGKIEFSAMVPAGKGSWAAGWTLGDAYVDELSWPYCGEIDILETVGYEMEGTKGIAHATVHTPAYYFKINNQISSVTDVENITTDFHTYAVEWTPTEVRGYVDGNHYYTYDKNANDLEWPFNKPQNIILNLAMGGGWGGAQGMDESLTSQKFVVDYVRVYELN